MMGLPEELADAEGRVARLKQQIAGAACAEVGHDWKHIGGSNAGCGLYCTCSIPVHECRKCGDCDYGENAESAEIKQACRELRA